MYHMNTKKVLRPTTYAYKRHTRRQTLLPASMTKPNEPAVTSSTSNLAQRRVNTGLIKIK